MCGIAAVFRAFSPPSLEEVQDMARALAHRGPDGEGVMLAGPVALGHRRLSIIDPVGGVQPMSLPDGSASIVFNGEIYNFRELSRELSALGFTARTSSDTEVLLLAWRAWGEGCLAKLRGMFAFAVADLERRVLFLARDALGIKPLYYRPIKDGLACASELGALKRLREPRPEGSLRALDYYLRYQYIPPPFTIYEGVLKLLPGHSLSMDLDCPEVEVKPVRWYYQRFDPDPAMADEDATELIRRSVLDAVSAQLVSDVPFGVLLSGGLDSTLVAWAMSQVLDDPIQAFAIGFDEPGADELPYARRAAAKLGLTLHERIVREDMLDLIPELAVHPGEPFGDSSILATWEVCRLAREHVPMVLSGDGGDEGFGGYHSHAAWMASGDAQTVDPPAWERYILVSPRPFREQLWLPEHAAIMNEPCPVFVEAAREAIKLDRLAYAQAMDFKTYLPGDILTKVDLASMAHGLEVRPPLLDPTMLQAASRIPLGLRYSSEPGLGGKLPLKRLLRKIGFEDDFVFRRKQGFAIPRERWFMPGRKAALMLRELLDDEASNLPRLFSRAGVEGMLARHTPQYDLSGILWLLLVFGLWSRANPEVRFA